MKKEIKFTEGQKSVIAQLQAQKKELQERANKELAAILEKENIALIFICESNGVKPVQGIELKEDGILVPVEEEVKLKKSK